MNRPCFTRLQNKVFVLGVPVLILLAEVMFLVLGIFVIGIKWYLALSVVAILHTTCLLLNKMSSNWLRELSFLFSLPYTRFYKEGASYLPKLTEVEKGFMPAEIDNKSNKKGKR